VSSFAGRLRIVAGFLILSVVMVVIYRFVPPPVTLTMLFDKQRHHQGLDEPRRHRPRYAPRGDRGGGREILPASWL
jgi:hypothetical protein